MKITDVRINGIKDPVGFLYEKVSCSWKVTDTDDQKQANVLIEVASDAAFTDILYRKEGSDLKAGGELLEIELQPRTIYYYRICVTGDGGDRGISEVAMFETGKMDEPWQAEWISPPQGTDVHPILQKLFSVPADKQVKKARLYITGVGLFEAYVNGQKLGNEFLTPYLTHYETNLQVFTFAADEVISEVNTLEIMLGKGWYMGTFGLEMQKENFGDRMAAIAELHMEYQDGSTECITTDESWKWYASDIEESGIYFGEILNRLCREEEENPLRPVEVLYHPEVEAGTQNLQKSHLQDRMSLPVIVKECLPVKEIIQTPAGETVLDMGQNFAGFIEFRADFEKGTRVELEFGEILQEGNFYNGNYRDAESKFVYVSAGQAETVRVHFSFYGFRYVRVGGWPGTCQAADFTGMVLYSDVDRIGHIETGNAKINRLYENTVWGLKSNFLDVPTDCPQRSERLGWTGDAQVFAPTACYHMDTRAFFHKFIKDLRSEQKLLGGGIPNYFPNIGHKEDVGSVWGDIATLLPAALYQAYGSISEMAYCYPLMKDWVDYIDRADSARGPRRYLYDFGHHFGDWLALDGVTPTSFKGSTDDEYVASVYYFRSAQIVREMAELLGKQEDAAHYAVLEQKIKAAIRHAYFTPSGRLAMDTQAAYIIAIKFGIYTDRDMIIEQFKRRLKKDCYQIKCGFVGAPLLLTALAEAGLYELAYDFLFREEFPSWLYSVNLGATTIWERWNSVSPDGTISDTGMNSLNHYAYGSVMEFVYAYTAGIRMKEPGYRKAIIEPHPDVRMEWVKCAYESVSGTYACNWRLAADGMLTVQIEVPFDCEAAVRLPGYQECEMILGAGVYEFAYQPTVNYRKPYHSQTTLGRVAKDPQAMAILEKYVPMITGMAAAKDPEALADTLEDFTYKTYLPIDQNKLWQAITEIGERMV